MGAGRRDVAVVIDVHEGPLRIGPAPLPARAVRGKVCDHCESFGNAAMLIEILAEAIRLAVAIDRFRRLLRQVVDLGVRAGEGLRRRIAQPGGERDAVRRLENFAADMAGMAELVAQQLVQFAEGQPGFGNLDLDLRAPIVLKRAGRPVGAGGRLHRLQLVQEARRHHLAGEAARRQLGRNGKRLDQKAAAARGVPHHQGNARGHREPDDRGGHPQQHAQMLFPDAPGGPA